MIAIPMVATLPEQATNWNKGAEKLPKLSYISLNDISTDANLRSNDGSSALNHKFTISNDYELRSIRLNDDDAFFEDDDVGDGWNDNGDPQTLQGETNLNGTDYPDGTVLEAEYELTIRYSDADGTHDYRILAVKAGGEIVGFTFLDGIPPAGKEYTVIGSRDSKFNSDGSYDPVKSPYDEIVPCFVAGTMILTQRGEVAVETLIQGDLVMTRDHGLQPIRWIGSKNLSEATLAANDNLRPVRIRAGALGDGLPVADLLVSPQHRILVRSKIAQRLFGTMEVLAPAKQLLQIDGIDIAEDLLGVEYFHILFDRHEIVLSNGAETESLYTGKEALKAVGPAAREEIFTIFPELQDMAEAPLAARTLLTGRQARKLAVRHAQNQRNLVC